MTSVTTSRSGARSSFPWRCGRWAGAMQSDH
jgi:hypothetical protein